MHGRTATEELFEKIRCPCLQTAVKAELSRGTFPVNLEKVKNACITLQPEETYINCWSEAPFCAWDKTYCVFYFNLHGMEITPYRIVPQDVYFSTSPTH